MWAALNRPNVFIKVPATAEGLPAIQQLISEGISVNVTLLFGLPRYRQVADAYLAGIEARAAQGKPVKHVASVASFFVSRIDALVDPLLERHIAQGGSEADVAKQVHGQVAVASAKMAYQIYKDIFGSARFKSLADRVRVRSGCSGPARAPRIRTTRDVKYVEALIGPDTVNTIPIETLDAYRDHGDPQARLEQDVQRAGWVLERLPELGISIDKVTQQLEDQGVEKFNQAVRQVDGDLGEGEGQMRRATPITTLFLDVGGVLLTRIIKVFLHLSKDEQRKRFLERIDEPDKNWKFSLADIHERKYWKQYVNAFEACLNATSTRHAPWYVVPADDKENARLIVSQIVLDALNDLKMAYPKTTAERAGN